MDDIRLGAVVRAVRRGLGLTQGELGRRAKVSQQLVSLIERGQLELVNIGKARAVARVLEIRVDIVPQWRGAAVDRLLDADHAWLVNAVVAELRALGWEVAVEWSFNHFGERGSVDVIGWREDTRTLLIVEVKSVLADSQHLLSTLDRYVRIAATLLPGERGWRPARVARVVVLPDRAAARASVARLGATFDAALPARTRDVRRWLRSPSGPLAGILFVRFTKMAGTSIRNRPQ
jgi:transcriptional regulator with XRE-family HTH domain